MGSNTTNRRKFFTSVAAMGTIGVSGCVDSLYTNLTVETVVDQDFIQPHEERIDIESGETLRVEVSPMDPAYNLIMLLVEEQNLDSSQGLSNLTEIDTETTREVTPESDTTYVVTVGWLAEDKNLDTPQYHLRILLE